MRPLLVLWLMRHGLPGWLAPSYFVLVGISAVLACALVLRLARRDGADLHIEVRTLLIAYVSALLGGYLLEALRAIPLALALHSFAPLFSAGRSAYGGLLIAVLGASLYRIEQNQPLWPFFDRVSVSLGLIYLAVRGGCFLAGCDYGVPTGSPIGVRYPPGSLAAIDHAARGFVPLGAPSLPTHPTQLYEGGVALFASACAALIYLRGMRNGSAFGLWIALYAIGRFVIEFWRGDVTRGLYHGWSSAQYISVALCTFVGVVALCHSQRGRSRDPLVSTGGATP